MRPADTDTQADLQGYELIDILAKETQLPEGDITHFLMEILETAEINPSTLNLEQLRVVMLNYLKKLN